jgi:hypothetical protein
MPVRRVLAHEQVKEDRGRVALMRGPIVYCAEGADNGGSVMNLLVRDETEFTPSFRKDLLRGVEVITGKVLAVTRGPNSLSVERGPHALVAIPYYAWANREEGEMAVWLAREESRLRLAPVPPGGIATRVSTFGEIPKAPTGYNDQSDNVAAVYDGIEPIDSADESSTYFRLRPPDGKPGSIEFEFRAPIRLSSAEVYWVDDRRFCRLPRSWRILYKDGGRWAPVHNREPYGIERDRFNRIAFDPVLAGGLRLEVEPDSIRYATGQIGPPGAFFLERPIDWRECGVIEWRVQ